MTVGPKRLAEGELGDLGRSLSVARGQLPSPERLNQIAERLVQAGIPLPNAETVPALRAPAEQGKSPTLGAETLGPWTKALIGVVGVGAALGLALATRATGGDHSAPARAPQSAARSPSSVPPTENAPQQGPAPRIPSASPEPRPAHVSAPQRSPESTVASEPRAPLPTPSVGTTERVPVASPPEAAKPLRPSPRPSASPEPEPPARETATSGSSTRGTIDTETPPESEIELLKRARSTATNDPAQALAIAIRHRAEFPNGAYAQERELIVIRALLRLGRTDEANARATAFRARYPRSAYLPQLERMLGAR